MAGQRDTVTVLGGGLSGLFAAVLLARRGFRVAVYERSGDPRLGGERWERPSLNLAFSERGLAQLERAGLREPVVACAAPARGRMVHLADGGTELEPYAGDGRALHFVLRRDLTSVLLSAAAACPGVEVRFHQRCVGLDAAARRLLVRDERTGATSPVPAGPVIAADGARSVVREHLQRVDRVDSSRTYLPVGYKEILLAAGRRPAALDRSDVLHVWRRDPCLLLGFPNRDGSLALSLHLPFDGEASFASVADESALAALVADRFPDVGSLGPEVVRRFVACRPNSMVTLRCRPWSLDGWAVLVGDAVHAMVPHYGQGATMGLEDVSALVDCVDEFAPDWPRVFGEYEDRRRLDADAMADLSLEHVGVLGGDPAPVDPALAALAEGTLRTLLGGCAPPLYTLVAFTRERLRDVARFDRWWRGAVRDALLLAGPSPTPAGLRAAAARLLAASGGPERVAAWLCREFPFWRAEPQRVPARNDRTAST
jgi:kynurenine 3-monooxygenase